MTRILSLAIALLLLALTPSTLSLRASAEQRRPIPRELAPKASPSRPFSLPAVRTGKLANGLTLRFVEDHRAPIVTANLAVNAGDTRDPNGFEGLAEATAALLTQGAGSRNAQELASEAETLGGRIGAGSDDDYAGVSFTVISENIEPMLTLFGDVIFRPTFAQTEIDLYKSNRTESLKVQRQDPAFLAGEQFHRIVFGRHPYSISAPTPQSIAAIDRNRIETFYKANYVPDRAIFVLVGDFDSRALEQKMQAIFSQWKSPSAGQLALTEPPAPARRIVLIDRPGSDQADIRIGNLAIGHSDRDFFPLLVANAVLGAGTASRLFLNVREQKGFAYDVGSSLAAPRERGSFYGYTQTRTEVAGKAIQEILREFGRIRTQPVAPRDLQNAKNFVNGLFSLTLSTQGGLAEQLSSSHMLGLGDSYLQEYRNRVDQVTAAQILQAARRHILTDRIAIIVVGDASKLGPALQLLGRVERVDIEGKPVRPTAAR